MIVVLTDFDMTTSGYKRICAQLCTELAALGYEILVLGLNYEGQEHDYPFGVHPVASLEHYQEILGLMLTEGLEIEAALVGFDIIQHVALMQTLYVPNDFFPYIGLFPLEAPPLLQSWAMNLHKMDERLIMTRFGQRSLEKAGVESTFIPIGVEPDLWHVPSPEEKKQIRAGLGITDDTFVVLTVADNQERKNLSRAAEIFADISVEVEERSESGNSDKQQKSEKHVMAHRYPPPFPCRLGF